MNTVAVFSYAFYSYCTYIDHGSSCIRILLEIATSENRKSPKTFFLYVFASFKFAMYIINGSVAYAIAHIRAIEPEKIVGTKIEPEKS